MYKVLIVDDEKSGCEVLEELISRQHPDLELLDSVRSIEDAIAAIENRLPDLVFLDIKLGKQTGFDLLAAVPDHDFHVIFVTAYSEHALEAIKVSALDYLLKPVNRAELNKAIERFKERSRDSNASKDLELFRAILREEHTKDHKKMSFPTADGYELIPVKDMLYLTADRNYCHLFLKNGSTKLSTRHLGSFEDRLRSLGFLRIHKSYIVNLKEVTLYTPGSGGFVTMSDGKRLEVSRRRKDELIKYLDIDLSKTTG